MSYCICVKKRATCMYKDKVEQNCLNRTSRCLKPATILDTHIHSKKLVSERWMKNIFHSQSLYRIEKGYKLCLIILLRLFAAIAFTLPSFPCLHSSYISSPLLIKSLINSVTMLDTHILFIR